MWFQRRIAVGAWFSAAFLGFTHTAQSAPSQEEMYATIKVLQSRIETLEYEAAKNRADANAPRSEFRPLNKGSASPKRLSRVSARTVLETVSDPIALTALPSSSKFAGPYAAIVGGYGFGPYSDAVEGYRDFSGRFIPFPPYADPGAASGGNIGGALGYNAVTGSLLLGIETRARYDLAEASERADIPGFRQNFPVFLQSVFGPPSLIEPPLTSRPITLSTDETQISRLYRTFTTDVSGRAGLIFEDWLIFARMGGGVERLGREFVLDRQRTITCPNPTVERRRSVTPFSASFTDIATGCPTVTTGGVSKETNFAYAPYFTLGAGVEKNFGSLFLRVEGNLITHFPTLAKDLQGYEVYYSTELSGAVGYRF